MIRGCVRIKFYEGVNNTSRHFCSLNYAGAMAIGSPQ